MRQAIRLKDLKNEEEKSEETSFFDLLEVLDFKDDLRYK